MKVLVTGASGYVGSHVFAYLLKNGVSAVGMDNFSNSQQEVLPRLKELVKCSINFVECDLRETSQVAAIFERTKPNVVFHFAGLKAVEESSQKPLNYYDNNVQGTVSLLQAMDEVMCDNLIFSSSATVYGQPESLPLSENHRISPLNPYGRTKWFVEEIIRDWCATNPSKSATLLRYFNPVGAHPSGLIGENPLGTPNNLMPIICEVASGNVERLNIYGKDYETPDGTGIRDYVHVCDLAEGHIAALTYVMESSGVSEFNLGTGRGHSVLEVVRSFQKTTGKLIPYVFLPRRLGDVASSFAEVSKAKALLNWQSCRNLEEMCFDSWNWKLNHQGVK